MIDSLSNGDIISLYHSNITSGLILYRYIKENHTEKKEKDDKPKKQAVGPHGLASISVITACQTSKSFQCVS